LKDGLLKLKAEVKAAEAPQCSDVRAPQFRLAIGISINFKLTLAFQEVEMWGLFLSILADEKEAALMVPAAPLQATNRSVRPRGKYGVPPRICHSAS